MDKSNKAKQGAIRARYLERVNNLSKCMMLWASLDSEPGLSKPWDKTELNVDTLVYLLSEMSSYAAQIDPEYTAFWKQLEGVISKAASLG